MPNSYTLTKIKQFRGMEGYGLNAQLNRDGKAVAFIMDDGNGGCMDMDFRNPLQSGKSFEATTKEMASNEETMFSAFCDEWYVASGTRAKDEAQWAEWSKNTPMGPHEIGPTGKMESWINQTVDAHLNKQRFDRMAKKKTLFRLVDGKPDEWRTIAKPYCPEVQQYLDKKYPSKVAEIYGVQK